MEELEDIIEDSEGKESRDTVGKQYEEEGPFMAGNGIGEQVSRWDK